MGKPQGLADKAVQLADDVRNMVGSLMAASPNAVPKVPSTEALQRAEKKLASAADAKAAAKAAKAAAKPSAKPAKTDAAPPSSKSTKAPKPSQPKAKSSVPQTLTPKAAKPKTVFTTPPQAAKTKAAATATAAAAAASTPAPSAAAVAETVAAAPHDKKKKKFKKPTHIVFDDADAGSAAGSDGEDAATAPAAASALADQGDVDTSMRVKARVVTPGAGLQRGYLVEPGMNLATRDAELGGAVAKVPTRTPVTLTSDEIVQLKTKAKGLFEQECERWEQRPQRGNAELTRTILKSGTTMDQVSALTLIVQEAPVHGFNYFSQQFIHGLATRQQRRIQLLVTDAIKELLVERLLPDRPLLTFSQQPGLYMAASDNDLIWWFYEDYLKHTYFDFIQQLERSLHDTFPELRNKALGYIAQLLAAKPEQEANLLALLVDKLGDRDRSVATRAVYHILQLLQQHQAMNLVVIRALERMLGRLWTSAAAAEAAAGAAAAHPATAHHDAEQGARQTRYYIITTLNQIVLSSTPEGAEAANALINIYFAVFEHIVPRPTLTEDVDSQWQNQRKQRLAGKKASSKPPPRAGPRAAKHGPPEPTQAEIEGRNTRMIAALLTGINRAFPYAQLPIETYEKHVDMLFRMTHRGSFSTQVQALSLLFQLLSHQQRAALVPAIAGGTTLQASSDAAAAGAPASKPSASVAEVAATMAAAQERNERFSRRFYTSLYETLRDTAAMQCNATAMYLNLLFRAIRADVDVHRVLAFVKRLLIAATATDVPMTAAILFMVGHLGKQHPAVWSLVRPATGHRAKAAVAAVMATTPAAVKAAPVKSEDDDDEEKYVDADKVRDTPSSTTAQAGAKDLQAGADDVVQYDYEKRDPRFAHGETARLFELICLQKHFHPTIRLYAAQLMGGEAIEPPKGAVNYDPLQNHTLIRFLDRFVIKNPKKLTTLTRGASYMQPMVGSAVGDSRIAGSAQRKRSAFLEGADGEGQGITMLDDMPLLSGRGRMSAARLQSLQPDEQFFAARFQANSGISTFRNNARAGTLDIDMEATKSMTEQEIWDAVRTQGRYPDEDVDPELEDEDALAAFANAMDASLDVDGDAESKEPTATTASGATASDSDVDDEDHDDVPIQDMNALLSDDEDDSSTKKQAAPASFGALSDDNDDEDVDDEDDEDDEADGVDVNDEMDDEEAMMAALADSDDEDAAALAVVPPVESAARVSRRLKDVAKRAASLGYKGDYFAQATAALALKGKKKREAAAAADADGMDAAADLEDDPTLGGVFAPASEFAEIIETSTKRLQERGLDQADEGDMSDAEEGAGLTVPAIGKRGNKRPVAAKPAKRSRK